MSKVVFSFAEPRLLALTVLCCSITVYFLNLRRKPRELHFLIGAFSSWTAYFLFSICGEGVYPANPKFLVAKALSGLVGVLLFTGFTYQFREAPFPREFRVAMSLGGTLIAACAAVLCFQVAEHESLNWLLPGAITLLFLTWAEVILIRRWMQAPDSESARPYREFAIAFILSVAAVAIDLLSALGALGVETASLIDNLLFLANLVGFTFVYVNNAPRPITFRVKIVGAALFAVLAVITVTWTVVASDWPAPASLPQAAGPFDPELAILQSAQAAIVHYNFCIVGAALFVLIFFPAFFRLSLVDPLNALLKAVDQVNVGDRDVNLPVRFNDEIGRLTMSFNQMTHSLKTAEEELKRHAEYLEEEVHERTSELFRKNEENERLLLNIFPASVAERLKRGEEIIADSWPEVTILFADIVGFTDFSARVPPCALVELLGGLISDFDQLARDHRVEKIKTIGDAYMAVAGLPDRRADHAEAAVRLAFDMLRAAAKRTTHSGTSLQLRIGINSGPVIAGVIGTHKFAYDLWGDTVNTAARMESHGEPNRIQVTEATYALLKDRYTFESRGEVEVKGKGKMATYFIAEPIEQSLGATELARWAAAPGSAIQ